MFKVQIKRLYIIINIKYTNIEIVSYNIPMKNAGPRFLSFQLKNDLAPSMSQHANYGTYGYHTKYCSRKRTLPRNWLISFRHLSAGTQTQELRSHRIFSFQWRWTELKILLLTHYLLLSLFPTMLASSLTGCSRVLTSTLQKSYYLSDLHNPAPHKYNYL